MGTAPSPERRAPDSEPRAPIPVSKQAWAASGLCLCSSRSGSAGLRPSTRAVARLAVPRAARQATSGAHRTFSRRGSSTSNEAPLRPSAVSRCKSSSDGAAVFPPPAPELPSSRVLRRSAGIHSDQDATTSSTVHALKMVDLPRASAHGQRQSSGQRKISAMDATRRRELYPRDALWGTSA